MVAIMVEKKIDIQKRKRYPVLAEALNKININIVEEAKNDHREN